MLLTMSLCAAMTLSSHGQISGSEPSFVGVQPDDRMDWWRDARFGMFIHWGLYAIPAGEWKGQRVPGVGEWIMHYAQIPPDAYETLVPQFNPVKFDADAWVTLAKQAGMKYLVITTKHHDGFCLFESAHSEYDIASTPFRGRDIMKEIADACRANGLRVGWYHSILDWHHPDAGGEAFPRYAEILRKQVDELLANYGPIDIMWFDGEWIPEWTEEQGRALYEHIREVSPHTIINNRIGKGRGGVGGLHDPRTTVGDFGTPEQEIPGAGIGGYDWETCMTMNDTWGFRTDDHNWKSTETLIRNLIDVASKGGNFLLNVGPTAQGEIPESSVERLRAMGEWLSLNGEAIYGTAAGPFKRLEWGRCTAKPAVGASDQPWRLYLHIFNWPQDGRLIVPGLQNPIEQAFLLADGRDAPLEFATHDGDVVLSLPAEPADRVATVVVLEIDGEPEVIDVPVAQRADGSVLLRAIDADVDGFAARYESGQGKDNIGFWTEARDAVEWSFAVKEGGLFRIEVELACRDDDAGSRYRIILGERVIGPLTVSRTGSWTTFRRFRTGEAALSAGRHVLRVEPIQIQNNALMNLKAVRLRLAE